MFGKFLRVFKTLKGKFKSPLHIEFNLSDYCNLNCKGCTHYSPLAPAKFISLGELEEAMSLVGGIRGADKIKEVFLLGGEPLLYPDIIRAITFARKYFPLAEVKLFTNGLLLGKMDEEFWETCRRERCVIALTRYPLKVDYDRIEAECGERGVEVEVFGDRGMDNSFFKFPLDPKKEQNGRLAHFRCYSYGCLTIDGGKVFPCSQSACVGHLNRRFATDFRWEKGDYIDLKDLKSVRQLQRLRNRPVPFCSYCKPLEVVSYGASRRNSSEWL